MPVLRRLVPAPVRHTARRAVERYTMVRAYRGIRRAPVDALRYLMFGHELDNFTYDIANRDEIAAFTASLTSATAAEALAYIHELDDDHDLRKDIESALRTRSDRGSQMPYGRRVGWYAIARTLRPSIVVETGVHDGLGSAVLLAALARNAAEQHDGTLISFDVRADVGWLVPDRLRRQWELVIKNPLEQLASSLGGRQLGMFVHDSLHTYEHETAELYCMQMRARCC